jgi:hypothetical protein
MSGNEASAIGSMRAVNSAESTFASSCANGNYAQDLASLILAPTAGAGNAGFISPDLDPAANPGVAAGSVSKSGYEVFVGAGTVGAPPSTVAAKLCTTPNGPTDAIPTYYASAVPNAVGSTGTRSFGTDQRATIYQDLAGGVWTAAGVATPAAGVTAIQ